MRSRWINEQRELTDLKEVNVLAYFSQYARTFFYTSCIGENKSLKSVENQLQTGISYYF